jgi:hypothetical protein
MKSRDPTGQRAKIMYDGPQPKIKLSATSRANHAKTKLLYATVWRCYD